MYTVWVYTYIIYLYTYIYIYYIYIDISHVLDRRRAIDQLGASWSNSTVVDVGAGTGVLSVMCGKRAKKVMGTMGSGGETGEIEDFQQILSIVDRDVIARKKTWDLYDHIKDATVESKTMRHQKMRFHLAGEKHYFSF